MAGASHTILGGELYLYRRGGDLCHCYTYLKGKAHRATAKEDSLSLAKECAEDWYMTQRGKDRAGLLMTEKTFRHAAEQFLTEYEIITEGQRSPAPWLADRAGLSARHLGDIERGQYAASVHVLGQLAEALRIDPCDLIRRTRRR